MSKNDAAFAVLEQIENISQQENDLRSLRGLKANFDVAPLRECRLSNLIPQPPCSFVQILDVKHTLLSDPTFFQRGTVINQLIYHLFQILPLRVESVRLCC